jgi:uncharacterized protein YkwD
MKYLITLITPFILSLTLFSQEVSKVSKVKAGPDIEKIERLVFEKTNEERVKRGLYKYKNYSQLAKIARMQSENMIKHKFFSHTDHLRRSPQQRFNESFPKILGGVGENIAYNYGSTDEEKASVLINAWMHSPGHRRNILSKNYSHMGAGIAVSDGRVYGTQNFGSMNAEFDGDLMTKHKFNSDISLKFKFLGKYNKDKITVYVYFPDRSAKYYISDRSYYTGFAKFPVKWIDDNHFILKFKADKGVGAYTIMMGSSGYYTSNSKIKIDTEK